MGHHLSNRLVVAAMLLAAVPGSAGAAVQCERGYQRVGDDLFSTPYCQDEYLAEVAREYGFSATGARLRSDPNFKKEICRYVFSDIRVADTCLAAGVPERSGGGR